MIKKVSTIAAEMADREAIRDCIYRYCRGIDRMDRDLVLSAYWPDATDEHGNFTARSAAEFVDVALGILATIELTTHVMHNILIDIQGNVAYVESYVQAFHKLRRDDGSVYDHSSSSRFLDCMECRDGEWRIKRRVVVRDWFREYADSGDWSSGEMGSTLGYGKEKPLDVGQRMPQDLSYSVLKFSQPQ